MPYSKNIIFLDKTAANRNDFNTTKKFHQYKDIQQVLEDPNYFRPYPFGVNGSKGTLAHLKQGKQYKLRSEDKASTAEEVVTKVFAAGFSIDSAPECQQIAPIYINEPVPIFLLCSKNAECDWLEIQYNRENQIEKVQFKCTKPDDYKQNKCKERFCNKDFAPSEQLKSLIDIITRQIGSFETIPLMTLSNFLQTLVWKHVFYPTLLTRWIEKTRGRKPALTHLG